MNSRKWTCHTINKQTNKGERATEFQFWYEFASCLNTGAHTMKSLINKPPLFPGKYRLSVVYERRCVAWNRNPRRCIKLSATRFVICISTLVSRRPVLLADQLAWISQTPHHTQSAIEPAGPLASRYGHALSCSYFTSIKTAFAELHVLSESTFSKPFDYN